MPHDGDVELENKRESSSEIKENMIVYMYLTFLGTLFLGTAFAFLLRSFSIRRLSWANTRENDHSWRDYRPLHRLLDPADFAFLRRRGIGEERIRRLRTERRRIYRLCLRSLAQDFNQVHRTLNIILVHSPVDRPDLAAELGRQRVTFYRNLMKVEFRLVLNAAGFDRMPVIDLLQPLEILQTQLRMLAVGAAA